MKGKQVLRLGWFGSNNLTLYLVLPGGFIKGESRITDLALGSWENTDSECFVESWRKGLELWFISHSQNTWRNL